MTDAVHSPAFAPRAAMRLRSAQVAAWFHATIERRIVAARTRRALAELSDDLLRDNRLTRVDIPFVAEAVARGRGDVTSIRPTASTGAQPPARRKVLQQ